MNSTTPPLRVGVAGLGVASTFALPEIAAHPRVRLTAAADARPAAREAFARQYGAPTYDTVEALCDSPHVDAVYVLTPNRCEVAMFLTQEAVRLAEPGTAEGTFCEGCPPLDRLFAQFAEGGGELLACPFCVDSRGLDAEGFVAHARVAGATPMCEWLGDEPGQIFS